MLLWMQVTLGLLALLAAAGLLGWWLGPRHWDAATDLMRGRLLAPAGSSAPALYTDADLESLPPPVVRYCRDVLREGQPIVRRAHISWVGSFNMGRPGADWSAPFTAEQDFVSAAPGRNPTLTMAHGMVVPDEATVEWLLPSGPYAYWRGRAAAITYE